MKNYRKHCEVLKINYSKNLFSFIVKITIFFILGILCSLKINILLGAMVMFFSLPVAILHFTNIEKKYYELINSKELSFYSLFHYMINLLEHGYIIYNALQECKNDVDIVLKDDVFELIEDIQNDSSITPFIKFSKKFENDQIKQMILMLYNFQENKKCSSILKNMSATLYQIQDESINSSVNKKIKSLDKYSFIPIILSAVTVIIFTLFIFTTIGDGLIV